MIAYHGVIIVMRAKDWQTSQFVFFDVANSYAGLDAKMILL